MIFDKVVHFSIDYQHRIRTLSPIVPGIRVVQQYVFFTKLQYSIIFFIEDFILINAALHSNAERSVICFWTSVNYGR